MNTIEEFQDANEKLQARLKKAVRVFNDQKDTIERLTQERDTAIDLNKELENKLLEYENQNNEFFDQTNEINELTDEVNELNFELKQLNNEYKTKISKIQNNVDLLYEVMKEISVRSTETIENIK